MDTPSPLAENPKEMRGPSQTPLKLLWHKSLRNNDLNIPNLPSFTFLPLHPQLS